MTDKPNSNLLEPNSNLLEPKRCELEETESYHVMRLVGGRARSSTIHVLECSECGRTCEHINGAYKRCPHCGAINVLDENYEPKAIPGDELEMIRMAEKYKKAPDDGVKTIRMAEKYQLADDDGVKRSDDGVDSREELEADVYDGFSDVALSEQMRDVLRSRVHAWLDRQKRITIREHQEGCKYKAKADELQEQVDSLTAELEKWNKLAEGIELPEYPVTQFQLEYDAMVSQRDYFRKHTQQMNKLIDKLTAERDEWKTKCDTCEVAYKQADAERKRYSEQIDELFAERDSLKSEIAKLEHDCGLLFDENHKLESERNELREKNWRQRNQLGELQNALHARNQGELKRQWKRQIEELTAERDRLRRLVDDGAYDCMTCEAKAELAEMADSLEAELARKQHVCDVQRESFLKLEAENAELRRMLADAAEAI